jgi:creatinine amidohydrolase
MLSSENTTFEIEKSETDLGILGIGACEQHSHHLPVETDFFFASQVSRAVAQELDAFLFQPLPYSTSLEHRGFSGTITLQPETLHRLVLDIAAAAADWGIRYLVLLNAHGGNFILNPTARAWNMDNKTPHLLLVDFFAGCTDTAPNLHAGDLETSMMLHLCPEKVHLDRAQDFIPEWERPDLTHFGMKKISPEGVWGYPTRATVEKGRHWFEQAVAYSAERIRTLKQAFES